MEIPCYNEIMFKYKVIDNYFDEKDLLELTLIANDPNNLQGLTDDNKIHIQLEEKFKDYLIKKYQNSWISYLDELYPQKKKLFDTASIQVSITGKNCKYPIHNDSLSRILSGVLYLLPKENIGTIIYDDEKKNPKEIKWKVNRAFVFSRKDKSTWHSYSSDGVNNRCTVNFNLHTKQLNKALIIDRGLIIFFLKKIKSLFIK